MVLLKSLLDIIAIFGKASVIPILVGLLAALILLAGYWVGRLRWAAIALMMVIVLFLLAGVIPDLHGAVVKGLFQSPFFMFLGAVLAVGTIWACFRRRPAVSQIPFWIAHAGIGLVLAGGAVDHFWGVSHQLVMPLHEPPSRQFQSMGRMEAGNQGPEMTEMPFMMRLGQLEVFSYDPKCYRVYRSQPTADGNVEFKLAGEVVPYLETMKMQAENPKDPEQSMQLWMVSLAKVPGLGPEWAKETIPVGQLVPGKGSRLRRQVPLGELALECDPPADKTIDVKLEFGEGKEMVPKPFPINHPAAYQGWRFYMMSYDSQQFQWALVTARHDPGRGVVVAGLWLIILGVAGLCFWRRRPEPAAPSSAPGPRPASFSDQPREGDGWRPRSRRRRSGSRRGPSGPSSMTSAPREGGN